MRQKWEYCRLTGYCGSASAVDGYMGTNDPYLTYFDLERGATKVNLGKKHAKDHRPDEWKRASDGVYMAHTIARLGIEGWEMVGFQDYDFWFRRPIIE